MERNKKKGFTIIELIVTLAVSAIVLGMVASLSILVNKILQAQRYSASLNSEFEQVKSSTENYISKYSSAGYKIVVSNMSEENSVSGIYIYDADKNALVSKMLFQDGVMQIFEQKSQNTENSAENTNTASENNSEIDESNFDIKSQSFQTLKGMTFEISSEYNLLKVVVKFDTHSDMRFLINLGGLEIGN